jgi:hypothetical protein
MSTPVRIILDIKDSETIPWKSALELWGINFPSNVMGFSREYGYAWYKVNPATNMPIVPLSTNVMRYSVGNPPGNVTIIDNSKELSELREEIEAVERAVYKVRADKEPVAERTKSAMKNSVKKLYTRWAALDAAQIALPVVDTAIEPTGEKYIESPYTRAEKAAKAKVARLSRRRNGEIDASRIVIPADMRDAMRAV